MKSNLIKSKDFAGLRGGVRLFLTVRSAAGGVQRNVDQLCEVDDARAGVGAAHELLLEDVSCVSIPTAAAIRISRCSENRRRSPLRIFEAAE